MDETCSPVSSDNEDVDPEEHTCTFPEDMSEGDLPPEEFDVEDEEELNNSRFEIVSSGETYVNYETKQKTTRPYLSRFEIAKIIGTRAAQIEGGAIPLCNVPDELIHSRDIAELEFQEKATPFFVRRYLPNGTFEDWKLRDFA